MEKREEEKRVQEAKDAKKKREWEEKRSKQKEESEKLREERRAEAAIREKERVERNKRAAVLAKRREERRQEALRQMSENLRWAREGPGSAVSIRKRRPKRRHGDKEQAPKPRPLMATILKTQRILAAQGRVFRWPSAPTSTPDKNHDDVVEQPAQNENHDDVVEQSAQNENHDVVEQTNNQQVLKLLTTMRKLRSMSSRSSMMSSRRQKCVGNGL